MHAFLLFPQPDSNYSDGEGEDSVRSHRIPSGIDVPTGFLPQQPPPSYPYGRSPGSEISKPDSLPHNHLVDRQVSNTLASGILPPQSHPSSSITRIPFGGPLPMMIDSLGRMERKQTRSTDSSGGGNIRPPHFPNEVNSKDIKIHRIS